MDKKSRLTLEFDKILENLARYTSFSAGEKLARHVTPTTDFSQATRWQIETEEARLLFDTRSDITVGGARDVRRISDNAIRGFILPAEDLLDVQATVVAARDLRRKLVRLSEQVPNLAAIGELIEECPGLVGAIGQAIDERGEVLDSASPGLAKIRKELQVVHGRIQEKLRSLISSSQNQYLQEPTITTRGGRYVVPLKANYKGRIKGIVHDQSNSGATLWVEPLHTVELNNEYRGLHIAETEEIQRILAELSAQVAIHSESIKRMVERLAELDLIFARARYANMIKAIRPEFEPWRTFPVSLSKKRSKAQVEEPQSAPNLHPGSKIWIRGARHPLLDPENVVPTDFLIEDDIFVVLITGPNTGGKTVSLKTMGLMVLMAQSGLHLPAIEAKLTLFDDIFADIGDEQSIEQNLSTFSGHMTNIVRILDMVDERSLVLLDELGSGTDPAEGASLAQAIVEYLRDRGATTFIATHYPELKVYASQTPGATNASLLFDVDTLMPTFEMSIGMPGRSNAFAIARRIGLTDTILDDAMGLLGSSSNKAESLLDSIYDMREKITAQEAGTRLALSQAIEERDNLKNKLNEIELERQEILRETQQQAETELTEVRREIRQVKRKLRDAESINRLKKLQKQTETVEEEFLELLDPERELVEEKNQPKRRKSADFRPGDTVLVSTLGATGSIVSVDKREAEIAVGRLHMRAQLDELELKARAEEQSEVETVVRVAAESPGMELDIRGKRVDEGLMLLEQYLDSAFLANLPWVRIIHGKGTGRLREAIRQALQENNHVLSWEEGRDGEGGAGVTVAKFEE